MPIFRRKQPKFIVENLTYRIGKLTLRLDDLVVLSTDLMLDKDQIQAVRDRAKEWFPNHKVFVLSHGMKLGVIRKEDDTQEVETVLVGALKGASGG